MGFVSRVRLASFCGGAATASLIGLYILHNDYKVAQESISRQMEGINNSLETRIAALEKFKQTEASQKVEAAAE